MKYRKLLVDGTTASEIGLGCMSFSGFYGDTTEKEAHETLAFCLDRGLNFWILRIFTETVYLKQLLGIISNKPQQNLSSRRKVGFRAIVKMVGALIIGLNICALNSKPL